MSKLVRWSRKTKRLVRGPPALRTRLSVLVSSPTQGVSNPAKPYPTASEWPPRCSCGRFALGQGLDFKAQNGQRSPRIPGAQRLKTVPDKHRRTLRPGKTSPLVLTAASYSPYFVLWPNLCGPENFSIDKKLVRRSPSLWARGKQRGSASRARLRAVPLEDVFPTGFA